MHLSGAHQVAAVIAAFYRDLPDLVILELDPARLNAPLHYEAPAMMAGASIAFPAPTAGLFPHLYGPLNADAIIGVLDAVEFDARWAHRRSEG